MKKKEKLCFVAISFAVVVILFISLIIFLDRPKPKEKISDEDFNILSTSWNNYQIINHKVSDLKIDWDGLCSGKYGGDSLSVSYNILTQQKEESLSCYFIINGEEKIEYDENVGRTSWVFENKTKSHLEGFYNLDYKKDNQIAICCKSSNKEGEICKSIVLKAKCI
jgi:hypothetical protein